MWSQFFSDFCNKVLPFELLVFLQQKTSQDKMLNREIRISLYVKKIFCVKKKKE